MSRGAFPVRLPVVIRFPETASRQDSWGRLEKLSGSDAVLDTRTELRPGDRIFLDFDLAAERFEGVPGEVRHAELDSDRYCQAEIRFTDEVLKRRLGAALLELLSR